MSASSLNGRLPANLFNYRDFEKGDRVERIYMHLVDGTRYKINDTETRYLSMLERAFTIICQNPSKREARTMITSLLEEEHVTDPRPKNENRVSTIQIIRDAENLFGRFEEVNKRIQRGLMRERLSLRLQKLYKLTEEEDIDPDIDKHIAKYEQLLMQLDRLNEIIDEEGMDTTLPELSFTTNSAALFEEAQIANDEEE